ELFLHISFYFVGEYADDIVTILEHDWHAKAGIMTLINRCLLTVSTSNKVMMHQLLQEMGRQIVREESKDPTKRSRVVQDDESYHVLAKGSQIALKTGSLAKIDKLKLLQLKHVKLSGSYKSFPELRWLCWHECPLKTIPCSMLMTSLVAIDMTNGHLREFESPMVLNKLKILILKGCKSLVSVRNLHRLPNLESLILWNCWNLTHVCKSICGLGCLKLLDLTRCNKLWKASLSKKCVNRMECLKALYICGGITQQATFSLPDSLKFLFLSHCDLKYNSNVSLAFTGQPFFYINLSKNLFECLPNYINLQALRVLDLTSCAELKSLLCLPSTLEELYTYTCYSLEKITFQSARFRLREFGYRGCHKLSEIQGLFRLVSVEEIDIADLGHMKWIKSCEYGAVKLVGDDIITGKSGHRVLYEFGIMSMYLPGIIYQPMMPEYMSSSSFLSFIVPSCPKKRKIKGLNVTALYKSTGEDILALLAKVSNKTKGLTWIYNPVVYSEPEVDEDAVWLSYWPIGNILDAGDEVNVDIIVGNGFIVNGCGATLVYMEGELCQENCKYMIKEEEVIGGDMSEFELTKGAFYLCRRDFFKSMTPDWLKMLVGDTIHYKELKGWKKSRQSRSKASYSELKTFRPKFDTPSMQGTSGESKSNVEKKNMKKLSSATETVAHYESQGIGYPGDFS
ncbi:TMV resistance protein N-like protein, partial [Tanacetum coccineum]